MQFDQPIKHFIFDDLIDTEVIDEINNEWPVDSNFQKEYGSFQEKWNTQNLPKSASDLVGLSPASWVKEVTGTEYDIFLDADLIGAGLHSCPVGGFLNMHVDFNKHPTMNWTRRFNVLIYLNKSWGESWGGDLYLGRDMAKKIAPMPGRVVLFETDESSWHGHPLRLKCPEDVQRRSLALYYYSYGQPSQPHSTIYVKK